MPLGYKSEVTDEQLGSRSRSSFCLAGGLGQVTQLSGLSVSWCAEWESEPLPPLSSALATPRWTCSCRSLLNSASSGASTSSQTFTASRFPTEHPGLSPSPQELKLKGQGEVQTVSCWIPATEAAGTQQTPHEHCPRRKHMEGSLSKGHGACSWTGSSWIGKKSYLFASCHL